MCFGNVVRRIFKLRARREGYQDGEFRWEWENEPLLSSCWNTGTCIAHALPKNKLCTKFLVNPQTIQKFNFKLCIASIVHTKRSIALEAMTFKRKETAHFRKRFQFSRALFSTLLNYGRD